MAGGFFAGQQQVVQKALSMNGLEATPEKVHNWMDGSDFNHTSRKAHLLIMASNSAKVVFPTLKQPCVCRQRSPVCRNEDVMDSTEPTLSQFVYALHYAISHIYI